MECSPGFDNNIMHNNCKHEKQITWHMFYDLESAETKVLTLSKCNLKLVARTCSCLAMHALVIARIQKYKLASYYQELALSDLPDPVLLCVYGPS